MKTVISGVATAVCSVVVDNKMAELQVYKNEDGSYFALDNSFLQHEDDDQPLYIPAPYEEGKSVQLIDSAKEKVDAITTGEVDESLIDRVLDDIKDDCADDADYGGIAALLEYLPAHALKSYLGE